MASEPSEGERVGAFAASVLENLYTAVYGERPVGVRSWCDDGALVLLLRLAGPAPFGEPREESGTFPCEAIPELLATAVRVQAGRELGAGSFNVDLELGLVTFVFHIPPDGGREHVGAAPSWDSVRLLAVRRAWRRRARWRRARPPAARRRRPYAGLRSALAVERDRVRDSRPWVTGLDSCAASGGSLRSDARSVGAATRPRRRRGG